MAPPYPDAGYLILRTKSTAYKQEAHYTAMSHRDIYVYTALYPL